MIPLASIGTLLLTGHRLFACQSARTICVSIRSLPVNVGLAWVERQVESTLAVRIHPNVHHHAIVGNSRAASQVKEHRHVVLVVRRIETGDIDLTMT